MRFGYARVSTEDQKTDRQLDALREYGVDEIFSEKISGTKRSRPELNRLLDKLRSGDTLVVYELKRLGRNTKQLLALAEEFQANQIEFVSLTEKLIPLRRWGGLYSLHGVRWRSLTEILYPKIQNPALLLPKRVVA